MRLLLLVSILLSTCVYADRIPEKTPNYGRYADFGPVSTFYLNAQMKDESIAKKTVQYKFIFKDVDSQEVLENVTLYWKMKNINGNTQCDKSQTVLTLDKKKVDFKVNLENYAPANVIIKPKNQYYYEYIVYLKRTDAGTGIRPVNE